MAAEYGASAAPAEGWVKRLHPKLSEIRKVHEKRWALYRARREDLFPKYLEAHRLEKRDERGAAGPSIYRERLGFSPRLAQGIIGDITGHITGTKITREWGPLSDGQGGTDSMPTGRAKRLYDDATADGRDWESFFGIDVLEQMLVTTGGVIVVDAPPKREGVTVDDAVTQGIRPYVRLVDWSNVVDWKWGANGFEWVKLRECKDERTLRGDGSGYTSETFVTYEFGIAPTPACIVTRYTAEGQQIGEAVILPPLTGTDGKPTLPVVPVAFGQRADAAPTRSGLLDGLDDIELDLANQFNELRDEQRSIVFGILAYSGERGADIEEILKSNSRFADLGPNGTLTYTAADGAVLEQHLKVIDRTYAAWRTALRQKPAELMDSAAARSGESFSSEFAVNWKPLLTGIAKVLDEIEAEALFLVAQFWGVTSDQAAALKVERNDEFRLEDEGSFLARSIGEITKATSDTPALPMARLIVDMMAAFNAIEEGDDRDALVEEVRKSIDDKRAADNFMNTLKNSIGGQPGDGVQPPDGATGGN